MRTLDAETETDRGARIVWHGVDISGHVNRAIVRDTPGRLGAALLKLVMIVERAGRRGTRMFWVPAIVRWFPNRGA